MPVNIRTYECTNCGIVIDSDDNAAVNVEKEGLRLLNLYVEQVNNTGEAGSPINDVDYSIYVPVLNGTRLSSPKGKSH